MHHKTDSNPMREEAFFKDLGTRVAALRQQRGLTQTDLAAKLGLGQQALATYENATRRLPSSLLLPLSEIFEVPLEELLGKPSNTGTKNKPGPMPKLQRQFQAICHLPKAEQNLVSQILERFLTPESRKAS